MSTQEFVDIDDYLGQSPNLTELPIDKNYPDRLELGDGYANWDSWVIPYYEAERDKNYYYVSPRTLRDYELGNYGTHPEEIDEELAAELGERGYQLDEIGRPRNPGGPSGIGGRGNLWHYGGRDTADGIITRETRANGLELLVIRKAGKNKAALPGGFVDPDEDFLEAALREVEEETHVRVANAAGKLLIAQMMLRSNRTTDHAWLQGSFAHVHLEGVRANQLPLGDDDADEAAWMKINYELLWPMSEHHRAPVVTVAKLLGYTATLSA